MAVSNNLAIIPQNLLKVLGILVIGLISINLLSSVLINTFNKPALLRGLSRSVNKLWCTMSGLLLN